MITNHDGDYDNCDDQVTSNAVCPLQAGKRWTGWTEGNLPSWYGLRPRRIHHHHVYVSSSHSFILITVILIVSISSAPPLFSIKIFILQVVSFFFFHLFLPFESVTFIFLDSWQLTFNDVSPIQGNTEPTRDDCKDSCVYKYSTHLSFDPHWFQERRGWADFLLCLRWFPRRILPSRSNLNK